MSLRRLALIGGVDLGDRHPQHDWVFVVDCLSKGGFCSFECRAVVGSVRMRHFVHIHCLCVSGDEKFEHARDDGCSGLVHQGPAARHHCGFAV